MPPPDGLSGGDKLAATLNSISQRLAAQAGAPSVSVGFMEGATYPDGKSVAANAATQEFGATINREAGETTIYRKVNAAGTAFLRKGRFVKKKQSNFASTHATPAYTITIPPRPFFRNMIKKNAPTWGGSMATLLKNTEYSARKTLGLMGELIKGQLQQSIVDLMTPPLSEYTILKKGFSKPLIETGHMMNSVDYEVST